MNIQKCLLLSVVFGAVSALSAQSVILNDSFTSGTGTGATGYLGKSSANNAGIPGVQAPNSGPTSSAFWYGNNSTYSSTSGPGASAESYNTGSGIALPNASTTQSVTANFEAPGSYASLAAGDLTMSFNFQFTGSTLPTYQATGIRFLLFNSASTGSLNNQITKNTGNSGGTNATSANWRGYLTGFDAGAAVSTSGIATIYNRGGATASSNYIASSPSTALGNANGLTSGLNLTDIYQAKLNLHEVDSGTVSLAFSMEDFSTSTDLSAYDFNVTDTGATNGGIAVTSFDGFTIGELGGENTPMLISNVTLVQAIPEPSTYAAVLGLATLGFAGIRSRRQRRLSVS